MTTNVGLSHPQVDVDARDEAIEERINDGQYQPPLPAKPLNAWEKISATWPGPPKEDHLQVFISLPSTLVQSSDDEARSTAMVNMVPTSAKKAEFTMKIRGLERWDHLCQDDLYHSNVVAGTSQSQFLKTFQERLWRKRYIEDGTKNVRAVLHCCRLPDFRSFSYMRNSRRFWNPV